MTQRLRIATRRSKLALWQAEHVAAGLRAEHPGLIVELVPMSTQGDRVQDRPLAQVGGKGLFVKELEYALRENRADLAVHSMKDMPADLPQDMQLSALLPRADPRDAFVSLRYTRFAELPPGARVGTSSLRRQCQLRNARPDIEFTDVRGNVDTRWRKLEEGQFDAIILAAAGLIRLGWSDRITESLDTLISTPAAGQGIIGIECRAGDRHSTALAAPLHDIAAGACIAAERSFTQRLHGGCESPIGAYARLSGETLTLWAMIGANSGVTLLRDEISGPVATAEALGRTLADSMLAAGGEALLAPTRDPKATTP
jgi:hydroxymethylbilane synthase